MKILVLIFIGFSLYASDVLTEYRINGIETLEKKMDIELTEEKYWSEYLKNIDTTFGYIESNSKILTCDKENSTLNLYTKDKNNTYNFQKQYTAFTGKNKGDKTKEGDRKTPIGIYQITEKLSKDTKLDPFYGPIAFVTSYPNSYDKYRGKNGHGIWIHGLPIQRERDDFTRGCIAINNQNLEALDKKINIKDTLLIINSKKVQQNISKEVLTSILSQLYSWRYAWVYSDIDKYLDFYAEEFVRADGVKMDMFKSFKTRVFKKQEKKRIIFNDINVIPYPNSDSIYQITFKEFYKSKTFQFVGNKILIVKILESNIMKIITEK